MDWERVRQSVEMDPAVVYLNTGTSGLVPKTVHARAVQLREQLHRNPTDAVWREPWGELWQSRVRLARHLGTTPDRLVFFGNISQAINTFCLSVDLPAGAEIVMTDQEYGSMQTAWRRAAGRRGWRIRLAPLPIGEEDPSRYLEAIESRWSADTRLLYLSHVLYSTGHALPLEEIARRARQRGILVFVDGAHGPGMLPLDLGGLGAHFYAANLHKWFLAPVGAAFLFVERGMEEHLQPWQVSWAFEEDRSRPDEPNAFGSTPWIRQFEMEGTRDITPWRVLHLCCDFHEAIAPEARQRRFLELSDAVRAKLEGLGAMRCVTPRNPRLRGALTSFLVPTHLDGQALRQRLWERHRVEINLVELGRAQYFRVSTHLYNTQGEIDALAQALGREL